MTASKGRKSTARARAGGRIPRAAADRGKGTEQTTKLGQILALTARPGGASLEELVVATGWQAHSVRGALAGALRKKGHAVSSEKVDGVRRYRSQAAP